MSHTATVLVRLRRHRARLGRFVLALFALASATASAGPCFSMAVAGDAAPAAHHDAAHAHEASTAHAHAHHQRADEDTSGASSQPASPQPASSQSASHCPHCPLAASMPNHSAAESHALCSAVDDTSDFSQPSASALLLKHVVAGPLLEIPPANLFRPPGIARSHRFTPDGPSVALHLRHCVFLI
jgi:hypothetical protein